MKLEKLVGKNIVRTKPVSLGTSSGFLGNGQENFDYSYTTSPLLLCKVTESHLVVITEHSDSERLLDNRWMDENWVDYDELIKS
jgi:hypothetical protein